MTILRPTVSAIILASLWATASSLSAAEPRLRIEELDNKAPGFRMVLPLEQAEKLRDRLNKDVDETKIAELLKELAEDTRSKIVIVLVAANVTKFKKELNEKIGKAGVTITVTGPKNADKDANPALAERLEELKELLPPRLRGLPAMLRTDPKLALLSPWFWKVTPREE